MMGEIVSEVFDRIGHTWRIGGSDSVPTEEDVEKVLDEAVKVLYDSDAGTTFETGGIIVEKLDRGYDVYVFAGTYY